MSGEAAVKNAPPLALTRAEIRARLSAHPPGVRSRSDILTTQALEKGLETLTEAPPGVVVFAAPLSADTVRRDAAVLVLLVERASGFNVVLTQRTADLKSHAGQISFPGGRMEASDADAPAAALREAREEIGLDPSGVEILGRLDTYRTVTGFDVIPVVGAAKAPQAFTPDPTEVADIFEVPLAFFLDPANHQRHARAVPGGARRAYYAMPYQGRYIWGATAGMLLNLYEVLKA